MGLIAEKCPRCKRVTRCAVTGGNSMVGGMIFGIPFVLPTSFVQCVCGECGHSFRSRPTVEERAIPAELALGLDTDALLRLTNPDLKRAQVLSELRADPQLRGAFALFDRLSPGPLHFDLESALARWSSLGDIGQTDLLGRVDQCSKAEDFARAMAGRYTSGAAGCLLGVALTAAVWVVAWFALDRPGALGWTLVGVIGVAAGVVPFRLLSDSRDRSWVRDVLLPEAEGAGVPMEWLLAVIEKAAPPRGGKDELGSIREMAPAIRTELDVCGRSLGDEVAGFGAPTGDHRKS